ncbi:MAG: site-specific DNA-methyltransferase [Candidatus Omnitrophica bacterium]|nr:site-specific DNA-methyltransferase [Candidatus Omnitrophota bacterium]
MEKHGTNSDNKTMPIHRWFSFMPGFSNVFVDTTFAYFDINENGGQVYDPFMGSGTTAVVGRKYGITVVGNESNKFLYEIGKAKIKFIEKPELLIKAGEVLLQKCKSIWKKADISQENFILTKCFSACNLKKLITLRDVYYSNSIKKAYKPYIFLVISSLLPRCAKVGISIPYISWKNTRNAEDPFVIFTKALSDIKDDLLEATESGCNGDAKIYLFDSRKKNSRILSNSINLVFTSPPYLNNFDYGEALKVYTYFWKITKDWSEITSKIRMKSLASATTYYSEREYRGKDLKDILEKKMLEKAPRVSQKIQNKIKLIRKQINCKRGKSFDILTGLYFKDMFLVLNETYRVLKKNGLAFIVIGDSAPYGIYVPTDKYLGELAIELGFSKHRLITLRPRGHKWTTLKNRHNLKLRESLLVLIK